MFAAVADDVVPESCAINFANSRIVCLLIVSLEGMLSSCFQLIRTNERRKANM